MNAAMAWAAPPNLAARGTRAFKQAKAETSTSR